MRSNIVFTILLFDCINYVSCNSSSRSNGQPEAGWYQDTGTIRLQVDWPDTAAPVSDRLTWDRSEAGIDSDALNITHIGAAGPCILYTVVLPSWFIRDRCHADERYCGDRPDPCE